MSDETNYMDSSINHYIRVYRLIGLDAVAHHAAKTDGLEKGIMEKGLVGHTAVVLHKAFLDTPAYRTPLSAFRALCLVPAFLDFSATVFSTPRRWFLETPRISWPAIRTMAE
jgi:hypothetical protein